MLVLSLGQAILLLIEHYKSDKSIVDNLKQLYIQSIKSNTGLITIQELFEKSGLATHYRISCTEKTIAEDVSRRYFETHLAFETLADSLEKLNVDDIRRQYGHCIMHFLKIKKRNMVRIWKVN